MVVYADNFAFSITHKTDGRDSVSKRYHVFFTLYYSFSFCVLITDVFLIAISNNRLCHRQLDVQQRQKSKNNVLHNHIFYLSLSANIKRILVL